MNRQTDKCAIERFTTCWYCVRKQGFSKQQVLKYPKDIALTGNKHKNLVNTEVIVCPNAKKRHLSMLAFHALKKSFFQTEDVYFNL